MGRTFTPEQRAQRAAYKREWYQRNREAVLDKLRERTAEERADLQAKKRARYAADPDHREKVKAYSRAYRTKPEYPAANAEYQRAYRLSEKGRATKRAGLLMRYFHLTVEEYEAKFVSQGGLCAICRQPETHRHRGVGVVVSLAVDHDHRCCPGKTSCGKCVRGLLCDRCNVGRFPDDPALLRAAADYFESYQ